MTSIEENTTVSSSIKSTRGVDCYDFISFKQRLIETCIVTVFGGAVVLPRVLRTLSLPKEWEIISSCRSRACREIVGVRKVLLVLLCLVFGMEIRHQLTNEPLVSLLQTCNIITAIQIYLLSAQASRLCMAVFRMHMHLKFVPFLSMAILFKRNMVGSAVDVSITVLHHLLISIIIPSYLVIIGGAYRCDVIKSISWPLFASLVYGFYQFFIIQPIAMVTLENLNGILCPCTEDPFYGPWYRTWAIAYHFLFILILGKLLCVTMYAVIRVWEMRGEKKGVAQGKDVCCIDTFMELKRD